MTATHDGHDFAWGTATAAYQIEGAVHEDGRGPSIWDRFCAQPEAIAGGETGDVACDHYHRFADDVALMRQLGVDAYRFSIAWPRVLPQGIGAVNQRGLDFYKRLVERLLEAGIKPYATLYHWDLPEALQERWGGWVGRDTASAFAEFAEVVSHALGTTVHGWMTLNEPWVGAWYGYGLGRHAPGYRDPTLAVQAAHHLLLAHGLAVPLLRRNSPGAEVGIALNYSPMHPASGDPRDVKAARIADANVNRWFLDPLFRGVYPEEASAAEHRAALRSREGDLAAMRVPIDFLGVNYYTRSVVRHGTHETNPFEYADRPGVERTTMGWEVYPDGLYETLRRIHDDYAPAKIYITENGAAYADEIAPDGHVHDAGRIAYIERHLEQIRRAIDAGIHVAGYFVWTLIDNFEWAEGYRQRFGLVYVDYATQRRVVKDSGAWYARTIAASRAAP